MSVDILTNEGVRALSHAMTSHVRLYIEDAVLVSTETVYDAESAAQLTYSDLPASGMVMTTTSCLPSNVEVPGDSGTENVSALDLEFSYLPQQSVSYNLIGVRARFYYEISEFATTSYSVGQVVSYNNGYYKCKQAYTAVAGGPAPTDDAEHWESVTVDPDSDFPWGNDWKALYNSYILLYVSQLGNPVTLSASLEVDYKLRIYLTNVATAAEMQERIVFDTLGPEYMSSAQLASLAAVAEAFGEMRAAVQGMVASGNTFVTLSSTYNTITGGDSSSAAESSSEEETMKLAYFKTQAITEHEFTGEAADSEVSPTDPLLLNLNRMDSGIDGVNYLSVFSTTGKTNRIKKARVTLGGSGVLESRAVKAAVIYMQAVIPASASTRGEDYVIGTFTVTLSRWGEWEDKDIELFVLDNVSEWKPQFRNTKPMALKALNTSVFYVQDFNIQDAFVEQTLPIYLELGIAADIILGNNMTTILD